MPVLRLPNGRSAPNKSTIYIPLPQTPKLTTHNSKLVNSELQGIALKETLIGAKVKEIKGEDKSATKVNYFRGNDQKKWKSNISTYDVVDLGEVYKGIELKLKAYGNNVEKLFYVKPGANPDQIKINLSGIRESKSEVGSQKSEVGSQRSEVGSQKSDVIALSSNSEFRNPKLRINEHGESCRLGEACPEPVEWAERTQQNNITKGASGLWVNEQGQLVAETELGPVTFTKPVAYQEIDGKRVDVAVEYSIRKLEDRIQNTEDINQDSVVSIHQSGEEWHIPHLIPDTEYGIHENHKSCIKPCWVMPVLSWSNGRNIPNKTRIKRLLMGSTQITMIGVVLYSP